MDTDQTVADGGATMLNMDDIMDVIYTYKCKFCSFTANSAPDISSHVVSVHIISKPTEEPNQFSSVCEAKQETARPVNKADSSYGETSPTTGSVVQTLQSVDDYGQLNQAEAPTESTQHRMESQVVQTDFEEPKDDFAEAGSSDLTINEKDPTEGEPDDGVDDGSAELREVFLCGQCSLGFTSIEECKQHMVQDHNISLQSTEHVLEVEEEEAAAELHHMSDCAPSKVSVGTQAQIFKKPGRKRKVRSEEHSLISSKQGIGNGTESESMGPVAIVCKTEKERVWKVTVGHGYTTWQDHEQCGAEREAQGKRRVRLPRALREDYYVAKKKMPRKRRVAGKDYSYICSVPRCKVKFKTEEALDVHMACHSEDQDQKPGQSFMCSKCQMKFNSWRPLSQHLWTVHSLDTDLLKCDQCMFRTYSIHRLDIHQQTHSDERPFVCGICGMGFHQRTQLRNHQVLHDETSKSPGKWYCTKTCGICKRDFANQKCLRIHMEAVHEKLKPYVCTECGHASSNKPMLLLHLRTHTGEKPFKCDLCNYATGDHNSLRRHRMRHTGQKPYQCPHCQYSCIQSISLKTHLKNKHPGCEGIYWCDTCQYHTLNKTSWQNHLNDHKNGLIADAPPSSDKPARPQKATRTKRDRNQPQTCVINATELPSGVGQSSSTNAHIQAVLSDSSLPTEMSDDVVLVRQDEDGSYKLAGDDGTSLVLTMQSSEDGSSAATSVLAEGASIVTQDGRTIGQAEGLQLMLQGIENQDQQTTMTIPTSQTSLQFTLPMSSVITPTTRVLTTLSGADHSVGTNGHHGMNIAPSGGQIIAAAAQSAQIITSSQGDGSLQHIITAIETISQDGRRVPQGLQLVPVSSSAKGALNTLEVTLPATTSQSQVPLAFVQDGAENS